MWSAAERHPVRALLLFALAGVIIVDGTRRTLIGHGTHSRTTALIFCVLFAVGAIPMSMLIRTRSELAAQRTQALLAYAFVPIVLAVPPAALGAAAWLLWALLALAVSLAAWWAIDTRPRQARQPSSTVQVGERSS
jgi:lysylphosphatidylglycerol synthetase-like protein (DUF2156 family)